MENVSFAYLESIGKSKVWKAYAEYFANDEIMQEGLNYHSGYVYIALENGISICSLLGREVFYIIYDNETDQEIEFDSIEDLQEHNNKAIENQLFKFLKMHS